MSIDQHDQHDQEQFYDENDFALDLLAGLFTESDKVLAEQGYDAWAAHIMDDVQTVGAHWIMLNEAGFTDTEIQAEVHMRMYTGQGFTHINLD